MKMCFCHSSNVRFLMIALAYAVPTGVIAGWTGVLDMVLTPVNVSQVGGKHIISCVGIFLCI